MDGSLRERKKIECRALLVSTALNLFNEMGFDAVSVDEIAARAGVSPRTFFRYFGSKEAVLFADQDEALAVLRDAIRSRPSEEPVLVALRYALISLANHFAAHREQHLRRARMAQSGAAVAAYQRSVIQPQWEAALVEEIAARLDIDVNRDPRVRLLAGVSVAVMSSAAGMWRASTRGAEFATLLDDAFDALEAAVRDAVPTR